MRNVWKGLVVGGLTGVAAGIILDLFTEAAEQAGEAGRKVKGRAPDLASNVKHVAAEAAGAIREADLPEKARMAADRAAEQIRKSDLPDKAKRVAERTAERARDVDLREKAKEAAERARDTIKH
jgi:hypothetical protein